MNYESFAAVECPKRTKGSHYYPIYLCKYCEYFLEYTDTGVECLYKVRR